MKDSDKLYDVIAVNLKTYEVRVVATDLTAANSESYVNMAVMRRGVDEEFFCAPPAGSYKTGDNLFLHEWFKAMALWLARWVKENVEIELLETGNGKENKR